MLSRRAGLLFLALVLSHILSVGVAVIAEQRVSQGNEPVGVGLALLVAGAAIVVGWGLLRLLPAEPAQEPQARPERPRRASLAPTQEAALARAAQQKVEYKRRSEVMLRYLSRLSMELRTSLTAVIGYAELVKEDAQKRQQWRAASDVDRVLVGARAGLDLVEDTLALAALERGDLEVEVGAFQLGTLLHDIIASLRPLGASLGTRIELESGPLGSVFTDRNRVRHILRNVIARGVNAAPGGLVQVTVSNEGSSEEPWIKVVVTDDGPLLTTGQLDEIFAVAPPEASDATGPGYSIGLVVARRFAERIGGRLTAKTDGLEGTRVTLQIPARLAPEAVDAALGSTRLDAGGVDR